MNSLTVIDSAEVPKVGVINLLHVKLSQQDLLYKCSINVTSYQTVAGTCTFTQYDQFKTLHFLLLLRMCSSCANIENYLVIAFFENLGRFLASATSFVIYFILIHF